MNKKYKFIYKIFIKNTIGKLLSLFFKRNSNYCILSCKTEKDNFLHNTKYLFLYLSQTKKLNAIWLVDRRHTLKTLKKYGYQNTYLRNSLWGLYYTYIAKYWLYDFSPNSISSYYSNNAICINLWHGIPLKRIEYDAKNTVSGKLNNFTKYIYEKFKTKNDYYIVNSEYEQSCYESAFLTTKDKIKILGSPRLDVLFHDIPNANIFMEEEFAKIKSFKEQGKKLLFYTPTFRDTGKDISGWLKSKNLHEFLKQNNTILVCKLHFADKNSLNFDLPEEIYKMDSNADIYPVLKYSDALITDYSSIYFDYLLLDKPIIYYPIDLEEYQKKCRGFYRPYEELTAGVKAYNEQELINAIQDVINGVDDYKEERKVLRDKIFKYQDGRNCERVVEWIKNLDK